ncbi:hypothetical protein VTN00DRAFT_6145 [Thermoascus crustaceus]|uniref:uncharacterized protein n=1 Tax=Thermoascus crustaceus TaxID=5088 RepID=UPI0037427687
MDVKLDYNNKKSPHHRRLASKPLSQGTKVILAGRRRDRLDHFISSHGGTDTATDRVTAIQFDITRLDEIPSFATSIATSHPDLDCIIFSAGILRPCDFSRPETVDLSVLDEEVVTNYTSQVHLTVALLPILQRQRQKQASLIYVGATLGIVPGMLWSGNYNATKEALHNWILVLREQLKRSSHSSLKQNLENDDKNNIKVVEIFPPAVSQTELVTERHHPRLRDIGSIPGMPLDESTEEVVAGLVKGEEQIGVGAHLRAVLEGPERVRQEAFRAMIVFAEELLRGHWK